MKFTFRAFAATLLTLAVSGIVPATSVAAQAPKLTLAQAQRMAVANHPQVRVMQFDTAAAQEAINIARSSYSPQVYGSGVTTFAKPGTRVSANLASITDPTVIQRTGMGLAVSQYVTDFGRTADIVKSYELEAKSAAQRGQLTQLTVLLNVTQAYLEVLRARALERVALATVAARRTLFRQVSVLAKAGLRSTLDVSIAQRDLASANQMVVLARARRRDAMASLSEALGSPTEIDYDLIDIKKLPSIPKSVGPLIDEMLANNPELAAMRSQTESAVSNAAAVAKEKDPTVTAYGYFGGTPISAANQEINDAYATAGVVLTIPIINGGQLRAAARQAEDQANAQAASTQDVENQLLSQTRIAYDDVEAARSNIDVTQQVVNTAAESYRLTAARYRIGLNSIVDLSQAQLAQTQAEIDHTNAIYDYIEQGAALDFVTGALAPAA
jgi:outer membrane protein